MLPSRLSNDAHVIALARNARDANRLGDVISRAGATDSPACVQMSPPHPLDQPRVWALVAVVLLVVVYLAGR